MSNDPLAFRRQWLIQSALDRALDALQSLAHHPAFAGDAAEFNKGGVGYDALRALRECRAGISEPPASPQSDAEPPATVYVVFQEADGECVYAHIYDTEEVASDHRYGMSQESFQSSAPVPCPAAWADHPDAAETFAALREAKLSYPEAEPDWKNLGPGA